MKTGRKLKQGMEKLQGASKKIVSKVPEPYKEEADKKLGLFTIKYVATLLYWDKKVQNYMREYEAALKEEDDKQKALQIGEEMKSYIVIMANNPEKDRRWQKKLPKVIKKIDEKASSMQKLTEKGGKFKNLLKLGRGFSPDTPEDLEELQDKMKEEIEEEQNNG